MRASRNFFQATTSHLTRRDDGKLFDVWFSIQLPDLDDARTIAVWLDTHGYTSAPGMVLNHQDKPRTGMTPMQARCVIALWSPNSVNDQQVKSDAGTARYHGNLIEVCVRKGAPEERYSDDALIVFNRLSPNSDAGAWRALLARVHKLCGEPPKKPSGFQRYARTTLGTLACVTSLGGGGAYYLSEQAEQRDLALEEAKATWTTPGETIDPVLAVAKRPSLTPTADLALASGGPTPNDYADFDRDMGTAPPAPQVSSVPLEVTPPPAPERLIQGPEQ